MEDNRFGLLPASSSPSPVKFEEGNFINMLLGLEELDSVAAPTSGFHSMEIEEQSSVEHKPGTTDSQRHQDILSKVAPSVFDSGSSSSIGSACNSTTEEVEVMSDFTGDSLQALIHSSLAKPMYKSISSNSLIQLRNTNLSTSLPSTQSAPLDSSTLKLQTSFLQELQRTSSLPNLASMTGCEPAAPPAEAITESVGSESPSHSPYNSDGTKETRIGKYTEQERKARIDRYRQKRSERNFQKKIKYACRKTLADSRPRVRGRFAKNDEVPDHKPSKMEAEEIEGLPSLEYVQRNHSFAYFTLQYRQ